MSEQQLCKADDCDRKRYYSNPWCSMHLQRIKRHGSPESLRPRGRVCQVEGCDRKVNAKGYCPKHYAAWARYGDPLAGATYGQFARCVLCTRKHHALGLCQVHYFRLRRSGDPWFDGENYPECTISRCFEPTKARGYCNRHYARWQAHGDPLAFTVEQIQRIGENLPVAPLVEFIEQVGGSLVLWERCGLHQAEVERYQKVLKRAKERGYLDVAFADHFAVRVLGTHPALVWGDAWWIEEQEVCADEREMELAA